MRGAWQLCVMITLALFLSPGRPACQRSRAEPLPAEFHGKCQRHACRLVCRETRSPFFEGAVRSTRCRGGAGAAHTPCSASTAHAQAAWQEGEPRQTRRMKVKRIVDSMHVRQSPPVYDMRRLHVTRRLMRRRLAPVSFTSVTFMARMLQIAHRHPSRQCVLKKMQYDADAQTAQMIRVGIRCCPLEVAQHVAFSSSAFIIQRFDGAI